MIISSKGPTEQNERDKHQLKKEISSFIILQGLYSLNPHTDSIVDISKGKESAKWFLEELQRIT